MQARDFFPLGIASGESFCNRKAELALLINNLQQVRHTVLVATRRYGKSSLALYALQQSGLAYSEVDFYMATSEKNVETYILTAVVELIGKALGPVDKFLTSIKQYVKNLRPKIDIGATQFKLELTVDQDINPAANIKEALLLLEKLLAEKQVHAVLLFDEFQNIGVIAQGQGIEAAIRHVAQKTQYLTFIFSGSNRRLLKNMFEDKARPLYKLCWQMNLQRIAYEHYHAHMQKAAEIAWHKKLDEKVIVEVLSVTECHPFYVNKLCDRLFTYYLAQPPTREEVKNLWLEILAEEKSDAIKEISSLSLGQKNVLSKIAQDAKAQLTSKQTMLELRMTGSSVTTALDGLDEKDVIDRSGEGYLIINPIVKYYVLQSIKK